MDKTKRKNNPDSLRRYWYVFFPLMIILSLMIYFPLRIALDELLYDTIFYSAILLICIVSAIRIYLRFRKRSRQLVFVILLCVLLSGWQVFDLAILRTGHQSSLIANTYYELRFRNDAILCHELSERHIGNDVIAIAYDIDREASWPVCGG